MGQKHMRHYYRISRPPDTTVRAVLTELTTAVPADRSGFRGFSLLATHAYGGLLERAAKRESTRGYYPESKLGREHRWVSYYRQLELTAFARSSIANGATGGAGTTNDARENHPESALLPRLAYFVTDSAPMSVPVVGPGCDACLGSPQAPTLRFSMFAEEANIGKALTLEALRCYYCERNNSLL